MDVIIYPYPNEGTLGHLKRSAIFIMAPIIVAYFNFPVSSLCLDADRSDCYVKHDNVIKWKHLQRYWCFVRGIILSPVDSPHKVQWPGALMFSLMCAWTNGCANNRDALTSHFTKEHSPHTFIYHILVPYSDPVIWAAVGSWCVKRVTLVQFWIGETGQIGGFWALWKEWPPIWHTVLPWLPFPWINFIWHSAAVEVCGVRLTID